MIALALDLSGDNLLVFVILLILAAVLFGPTAAKNLLELKGRSDDEKPPERLVATSRGVVPESVARKEWEQERTINAHNVAIDDLSREVHGLREEVGGVSARVDKLSGDVTSYSAHTNRRLDRLSSMLQGAPQPEEIVQEAGVSSEETMRRLEDAIEGRFT